MRIINSFNAFLIIFIVTILTISALCTTYYITTYVINPATITSTTALAHEVRHLRITLLVIALGTASVLVGGCHLFFRKFLFTPLREVQDFTRAVANGDYKIMLRTGYRFELARLATDIQNLVTTLKGQLSFSQGVLNGFVVPCTVFVHNKVAYMNQQMLDLLERPGKPEEYYGLTSGELGSGDPMQETLAVRVYRENKTMRAESNYKTPSGSTKIIGITSTPFNDLEGKLLGVVAVWYDLTDIRTQQKKIEDQNERIAKAANAANTVSDQVASASEELAAQIEQSNRGSDQQRTRTTEVAAAMEELNSAVFEVAKNAGTSADLAEKAKQKAQDGSEQVSHLVSTISSVKVQAESLENDMTQLGQQAEGIGQIIGVISDIADQTNLLALNAAIEAARAGDAGRGFAVVADEVRKLAEKTMNATNEVGAHIRSVQESARKSIQNTQTTTLAIEKSAELAHMSGAVLSEIVGMVDATADHMHSIAAASEEQSAASEQISHSTEEINRIATDIAETMVQSGKAVSDLAQLASRLRDIINNMNNG